MCKVNIFEKDLNVFSPIIKMKNILFIICSIILPILSLKQVKPKLCINCKHFINDNDNGKYGKCSLFPKKRR